MKTKKINSKIDYGQQEQGAKESDKWILRLYVAGPDSKIYCRIQ